MPANQETFRQELRALGFDEVRFAASGEVPEQYRKRFRDWLKEGRQADMHWIERSLEKRFDLEQVLPGVQSIILLGVNYLPERENARKQTRWAKYALNQDYHDTIKQGLVEGGHLLERQFGLTGTDYRYYTDTGPVMERGWAARSGLGWQGKNGMLISRQHGNWLFLAAILVRFPFQPDPPLRNHGAIGAKEAPEVGLLCGTCTRCMEACPTKAIVSPGIVDARLCISYQTIENKGIIPRELRSKIGGRLFGCDICLDVCPWNRFARTGRRLLLAERYDLVDLTLPDLLAMTQEDFSRTFTKTPVKRLKWRGLLRNACIVAGNLREATPMANEREIDEIVPLLVRLAASQEAMVRVHAIWAVHRLQPNDALSLLESLRSSETDEDVLEEYRWWDRAFEKQKNANLREGPRS